MKVEKIILGAIETNCYLAYREDTRAGVIIDPADDAWQITRLVEKTGARPEAVLLTHGHYDHMLAAKETAEHYGIPVCAFAGEAELLADATLNLSGMWHGTAVSLKADRLFTDGEILDYAGIPLMVIHTPGHTAGSVCFYSGKDGILFSGDTLFCGSTGRSDLPTGSGKLLRTSIRKKLFVLPDETVVYPGHGEETTIGYEKYYNPYLT